MKFSTVIALAFSAVVAVAGPIELHVNNVNTVNVVDVVTQTTTHIETETYYMG